MASKLGALMDSGVGEWSLNFEKCWRFGLRDCCRGMGGEVWMGSCEMVNFGGGCYLLH